MNAPDRLDSVRLPEGQTAKIKALEDGKMTNAMTYQLMREDHTLGHLLRMCVRCLLLGVGLRCRGCSLAGLGAVCGIRGLGAVSARSRRSLGAVSKPNPPVSARIPSSCNPRLLPSLPHHRELLRDPAVKFAGYKHPHPLENDILLKVQAAPGVSTTSVLSAAAARLEAELGLLASSFREQVERGAKEEGLIPTGLA